MREKFTSSAKRVIKYAHEEAKAAQSDSVGSENILLGIIFDRRSIACGLLKSLNVDLDELDTKIRENLTYGNYKFENLNFDENAKQIIELAYKEARDVRHTFIGSAHMVLAILKLPDTKACQILNSVGVDYEGYSKKFLEKLAEDEKKANEPESIQAYSVKTRQKTPGYVESFSKSGMWERFTSSAKRVIKHAHEEAVHFHNDSVDLDHMLLGLLKDENLFAVKVLKRMDIPIEMLRVAVIQGIPIGTVNSSNLDFSNQSKELLELAYKEARSLRNTHITSEHLLLGLLKLTDTETYKLLNNFNITFQGVLNTMAELIPSMQKWVLKENELLKLLRRSGYTFETEAILRMAFKEAALRSDVRLTPEDLLFAILKLEPLDITAFLNKYGVTYDQAIEYFKDTKKEDLPEKKPDDDTKGLAEDEKT